MKVCEWCGQGFETGRPRKRFCSYRCQRRAERFRYMKRRAEAIRGKRRDKIGLKTLLKRDGGICRICGEPVDPNDFHRAGKWFVFGRNFPTIDHIIPLSKGGTHTFDNVQLAHMWCNCVAKEYGMKVYISGKISGLEEEEYRARFGAAEKRLKAEGHSVMNPAWIKSYPGYSWEDYMRVALAMLDVCDAVYMLANWKDSRGAKTEHVYAKGQGKKIMYEEQGGTNA